MKATATKVRSEGNLDQSKSFEMSFDEKKRAKMSNVLIDIYEDLETAIIREYAANAYDAHVAVGQKRPIEITVPTASKPNFIVRDHGIGMSMEDVKTYYAKYGASTKDEDNDTIGSFGLGCKAALAIAPSFVLETVKDGEKSVLLFSRERNSLGKVQPLFHGETDAPNGTTVRICINEKFNEFRAKTLKVFRTWPEGSVLIDGEAPVDTIHNTDNYFNFGNVLHLGTAAKTIGGQTYLVNMGGIAYPIKYDQMRAIHANIKNEKVQSFNIMNYNVVITVGIGDVDLISNRESVRWTKRSLEAASAVLEEGILLAYAKAQNILDSASTVEEIYSEDNLSLMVSAPALFNRKAVTWKGEKLPSDYLPINLLWNLSMDTARGAITETGAVIYSEGRQQKRYGSTESFKFGFEGKEGFKKFLTKDGNSERAWLFVDLRNEENRKYASVASTVRAYLKNIDSRMVQVVYVLDDSVYSPWMNALIKIKPNAQSLTLTEMKAFLASQKKAAKQTGASTVSEVRYKMFSNTALKNGITQTSLKGFTAPEIRAMIDATPGIAVFADDNLLTDKNISNHYYFRSLVPDDALIVIIEGGKKVSGLEKKLKIPVRTDLGEVIGEAAMKQLENFDFLDVFCSVALPYSIERVVKNLTLSKNGFLKQAFNHNVSESLNQLAYKLKMIQKIEGIVIPETSVTEKVQEVMDELPLFFDNNWNTPNRSDNFWKHMSAYIDAASDTVDKIVARKG